MAGLVILCSCKNESNEKGILDTLIATDDTPKCEDEEVKSTVISLLTENKNDLTSAEGHSVGLFFNNKNDGKIINLLTKSKDKELKTCTCEGNYEDETIVGSVSYTAQKNSEGEIIVQIDYAGAFQLRAFNEIKKKLNNVD